MNISERYSIEIYKRIPKIERGVEFKIWRFTKPCEWWIDIVKFKAFDHYNGLNDTAWRFVTSTGNVRRLYPKTLLIFTSLFSCLYCSINRVENLNESTIKYNEGYRNATYELTQNKIPFDDMKKLFPYIYHIYRMKQNEIHTQSDRQIKNQLEKLMRLNNDKKDEI